MKRQRPRDGQRVRVRIHYQSGWKSHDRWVRGPKFRDLHAWLERHGYYWELWGWRKYSKRIHTRTQPHGRVSFHMLEVQGI